MCPWLQTGSPYHTATFCSQLHKWWGNYQSCACGGASRVHRSVFGKRGGHSSVNSWSEGNWRMERTFHKLTGLWCNNWMNRVTLSISISHDWVYQQWNIQANVTWLHAPILKTRLHTYLYKQTNYIYFLNQTICKSKMFKVFNMIYTLSW